MPTDKDKGGRPPKDKPKFTKKTVATILRYLSMGAHVETAALAGGISRESLHEWLRNANKAERDLQNGEEIDERARAMLKFREDLNRTIAEAELTDLDKIDRAGDTIWQAAAWKLERRFGDRWAMRSRTIQENHNIDLKTLTDDQLLRLSNGEPLSSVLSQSVPTQS